MEIIPSTFAEDLDKAQHTAAEYVRNTALHKCAAVSPALPNPPCYSCSPWRDCHFADVPSPSLLTHVLQR